MSSASNGSGSSSDLDDEFLRVLDSHGEEEDQPSPSSSGSDERREATIVQTLVSAAAGGGTSTNDNTANPADGVLGSHVHDIDQSRLAHQSNTNEDHDSDSRDGGVDASSIPLQQLSTPSHASTISHNTTTDEDTLSQALMNQVREYNRLHQAHIQQQTSETAGADCLANDDEDRLNHHTHTDHDIQTSLRDLIIQSSEHKSDTNTIGRAAHDSDSEVEGNRDRNRSVDIDQEILNTQEREYERLQQRRLQSEQEMESQANTRQLSFDRLFPMCHIEDEMGRRRRGRFVQNFHLATSTQTDVNTYRMVCASCSANLYTSPTAVLSFCPICRSTTTTIQEGKTPE